MRLESASQYRVSLSPDECPGPFEGIPPCLDLHEQRHAWVLCAIVHHARHGQRGCAVAITSHGPPVGAGDIPSNGGWISLHAAENIEDPERHNEIDQDPVR